MINVQPNSLFRSVCLQIDNREFRVTSVIDSLTAQRIDASEARARGILVDGGGSRPMSPTRVRSPTRLSPTRRQPRLLSPDGRDRTSSGSTSTRSPGLLSPSWHPGDYDDDDDDDDEYYEYYLVETSGERIPLLEAIDVGWVFVEYVDDTDELEHQVAISNYITVFQPGFQVTYKSSAELNQETGTKRYLRPLQ